MGVSRFDLAFDLIASEQRDIVGIHLQATAALSRHEALHVLGRDRMGTRLIDEHFTDVVGEIVAKGARDGITLAIDEERGGALEHRLDDLVPLDLEVIEIPLELFGGSTDTGGTHDGAHTRRNDERIHDALHLVALFTLDTTADATRTRIVRHQDEESTGERDVGSERCTLVATLFFLDLHHDVLTFLQDFAHVDAAARRVLEKILSRDFFQRQEAVALGAVIDEAGFERGLDAGDTTFIDVRFFLFAGRKFDREVVEFLTVNQCDAQFFLLGRVYQHSFHGPQISWMGPTVLRRLSTWTPLAYRCEHTGERAEPER